MNYPKTEAYTPKDQPQTPKDLPRWRKYLIVLVLAWMTLNVTASSTSLLVADVEIAADLQTTPELINVTNAGTLVVMGLSALFWSPLSDIIGRKRTYNACILFMLLTLVGTAVAPSMAVFAVMRVLGGLAGTYFMVASQTIIADIFEPVLRGRATGFVMVGTNSGPAIGPVLGGVVVTYTSWRVTYWLQAGMTAIGLLLSTLIIPDIKSKVDKLHSGAPRPMSISDGDSTDDDVKYITKAKSMVTESEMTINTPTISLWQRFNPWNTFKQLQHGNVLLANLTCGFLAVTQYGILTSVRHTISPRFSLTTPFVSGLFYLAPGTGFVVGSIAGGWLSDRTVQKHIKIRGGVRIPKDRLNSGLVGLFLTLPVSMLAYAWTLQEGVGGLAWYGFAAFWMAFGFTGSLNSLNTYTAEVFPKYKAEVVCSKYIVQYAFGGLSTAFTVPLLDSMGVGASFTLFVVLDIIGGLMILFITRWGPSNWS